jgi:hypothetical protein
MSRAGRRQTPPDFSGKDTFFNFQYNEYYAGN